MRGEAHADLRRRRKSSRPLTRIGLNDGRGTIESVAPGQEPLKVDPAELVPSHRVDKSRREMAALKESIKHRGFLHLADQPVAYVAVDGRKHIVDGHHRVRAARDLGLEEIPAVEVRLPYKGYFTEADLFDWDG